MIDITQETLIPLREAPRDRTASACTSAHATAGSAMACAASSSKPSESAARPTRPRRRCNASQTAWGRLASSRRRRRPRRRVPGNGRLTRHQGACERCWGLSSQTIRLPPTPTPCPERENRYQAGRWGPRRTHGSPEHSGTWHRMPCGRCSARVAGIHAPRVGSRGRHRLAGRKQVAGLFSICCDFENHIQVLEDLC
jgi:hypothetical protein